MKTKYLFLTVLMSLLSIGGCKALAEGMAESYRSDREERLAKLDAQVTSCEGLTIVHPATFESADALGQRRFTIPVRNNTSSGKLVKLRYELDGQIMIHYSSEENVPANDVRTLVLFSTRSTNNNPFSRLIEFGGCR